MKSTIQNLFIASLLIAVLPIGCTDAKGQKTNSNPKIVSPDTKRSVRIPPNQRKTDGFPVLQYGSVPKIDTTGWTLRIYGLVERETTLTLAQFKSLPKSDMLCDIHCVTGWSKLNTYWAGVPTVDLKTLVKPLPDAKYVIVHATKDFTTNLTIEDFFGTDVMLAYEFDTKPLTADHGAPVRLVVPQLYFWKSAKWVTAIEFTNTDRPGFWEIHGYNNHGDPWKEERYSD
jgi:DMSO/TMAO reductase YedYZ molybdopterin-dependent catalytic subunit